MPESVFETVLAATVHEMKNSLGLLMNQLDELGVDATGEKRDKLASISYEASRINTSLMEMLSLYKLENRQLALHLDEVVVIDFIEDCAASFASIAASRSVRIEVDCEPSLIWFFDPDLVAIAVNNIVGNSVRYARSLIRISAIPVGSELCIRVEDDGKGYPQNMLDDVEAFTNRVELSSGSTGLGLYFAHSMAELHERDGRRGRIRLANGDGPGGGGFSLFLP